MHDKFTHYLMTKSFFPNLPARDIYRTNHAIDNASLTSMAMNRAVNGRYKQYGQKNPMDIFNLARGGHRSRNHDLMTGMITAYSAAGTNGIYAMMGHFMADSFSNMLLERFGADSRNIFESMYLMNNRQKRYW